MIKKCDSCAYYSADKRFQQAVIPMSGLSEKLGVVCIGPLPKSDIGSYYIILEMDYAIGLAGSITMKNKNSKNISDFLIKQVFLKHGIPRTIQVDSGKEFSNRTKDFARKFVPRLNLQCKLDHNIFGKQFCHNISSIKN